jgi:hypothetical protein
MQALIELIAGFVALLATAALSQFGLELNTRSEAPREIHRVRDCAGHKAPNSMLASAAEHKRDC